MMLSKTVDDSYQFLVSASQYELRRDFECCQPGGDCAPRRA
jgi:hypothetical protein